MAEILVFLYFVVGGIISGALVGLGLADRTKAPSQEVSLASIIMSFLFNWIMWPPILGFVLFAAIYSKGKYNGHNLRNCHWAGSIDGSRVLSLPNNELRRGDQRKNSDPHEDL